MPDSVNLFDSSKQVSRASILVDSSKTFLLVKVTWSKTIQYRQRVLYIPICSVPGSPICPVNTYVKMCQLIPAPLNYPAFVYTSHGVLKPLVYSMFVKKLRFWLLCVNVQSPHLYSSHSLRRGGATWAFQSGVSPELIKLQGDWQSDCYTRYVNVSLTRKFSTTSKMAFNILKL